MVLWTYYRGTKIELYMKIVKTFCNTFPLLNFLHKLLYDFSDCWTTLHKEPK